MTSHSTSRGRLYIALVVGLLLGTAASARGLHDLFPFRLGVAVSDAQIAGARTIRSSSRASSSSSAG